jgi:shikimate kinase
MTINGFAFAAALERPAEPMMEALPEAEGVSLSGTGPSYVAVGDPDPIDAVEDRWAERPGQTIRTTTQNAGATVV